MTVMKKGVFCTVTQHLFNNNKSKHFNQKAGIRMTYVSYVMRPEVNEKRNQVTA